MSMRTLALLERWASFLPERIAEENLRGFIEQLNRGSMRRVDLILFTGKALPLFQLKDEPEGERRSSCGVRGIIA